MIRRDALLGILREKPGLLTRLDATLWRVNLWLGQMAVPLGPTETETDWLSGFFPKRAGHHGGPHVWSVVVNPSLTR